MSSEYYHAIHKCCERYRDMLIEFHRDNDGNPSHSTRWEPEYKALWDFIFELMFASRDQNIPLNKANRWLGYIQGTLIAYGHTDVETERNWTRPLFRPLDFNV